MLGGNSEFLAKSEMKKMQYTDELIAEATGFAETDNEEILEARETFRKLEKKYKDVYKRQHLNTLFRLHRRDTQNAQILIYPAF